MYHPTRGGVRGGRDQFSWDDVKVDKHRENYLGHSLKAPVGRWQKGKDLHWYTRDKNSGSSADDALKEEIQRIKEEEEQAMREALGLAPKRSTRSQGNKLDKHEFAELVKRGSTAEDLGAGHADAARVDGLGFSKAPRPWEDPSTLPSNTNEVAPEPVKVATPDPSARDTEENKSEDESSRKKRRREEKKQERHEKRRSRDSDDRRKHNSEDRRKGDSDDRRKGDSDDRRKGDSDDRRKHRKDRERRRHDSDSN